MRILPLTNRVAERIIGARHGSDRAAEETTRRIVREVRQRGDSALFAWTKRLDGLRLTPESLWLTEKEIHDGARQAPAYLRKALAHAARNIRRIAVQQLPKKWTLTVEPGVRVAQRVTPLEAIGCYIPGGRFSLVSTLLMTAVPAQVAGVRRIVATCARPNPALLAAAQLLGIREIARIGGAQAIAALAYGTTSVPRVEKIFGPGNRFVTAAKRLVSWDCAIDLLAGPTELLVVATRGNAAYIAADLVAQAEHDPDAVALLATTSRALAKAVQAAVERQLKNLPSSNPARNSIERNGAILIAPDAQSAARFANRFAPEHLSVPGAEGSLLQQLEAAGSIFIGPLSAQSIGDYASGTNHVLPTSGWARSRGGLSTWDFVRCTTVQQISPDGLRRLLPVVSALADAEGLVAHRRAVEIRQ